jgi:hypothetical protein
MLVQLNSKVADADHGGSGALESHQVKYGNLALSRNFMWLTRMARCNPTSLAREIVLVRGQAITSPYKVFIGLCLPLSH